MKILFVLAAIVLPASFFADTAGGGIDISTALLAYGVAAPFAGLCFLQMQRNQKKADAAEAKVEALQNDAINREREFAMRLAPLLYDGALLYQRGNETLDRRLAQPPPAAAADDDELHALRSSVEELLRKLGEGDR